LLIVVRTLLRFACAKAGLTLLPLSWRLSPRELQYQLEDAGPALFLVSEEHDDLARATGRRFERLQPGLNQVAPRVDVVDDDGLLLIYTSGTTGLPKGALISHRAEVARMHVAREELGLTSGDGFIAWPPMFHMASSDQMIACLCTGARVFVVDGFDLETIVPLVAALAHGGGATVRLLRVFPVPERVVGPRGQTIAYTDQEMARLTAEGLDDLRRLEAELHGIPVESVVRFGDPVEEILLEAEVFDADLLALATSARGRLRRAFSRGVAGRAAAKATTYVQV